MSKNLMEKIQLLKSLAEKATPGPWKIGNFRYAEMIIDGNGKPVAGVSFSYRNNSDYIAAANPAMILELLAGLDALQKENERLKLEMHDLDASCLEMSADLQKLEKEAEWLANELQESSRHKYFQTAKYWRELARKRSGQNE